MNAQAVTMILSTALSLFLIMGPLGNTPVILALLKDYSPKRQRQIILRELLFALTIIIFFHFVGQALLDVMAIKPPTIRIAGGVILFVISIKMIFPQLEKTSADLKSKDPFIVPIAVPLIAGPSLIAAVMLYANQINDPVINLSAIFLAWAGATVILVSAPFLKRILRDRGLIACERLMGLLLIFISIQMFLDGDAMFVKFH